jgi:hypothetical protein
LQQYHALDAGVLGPCRGGMRNFFPRQIAVDWARSLKRAHCGCVVVEFAINPCRDDMVAFSNMRYIVSFGGYDSRRFMTQQRRETMTRPRWPAHRVKLRVTDTAGKELHQNLVRPRIGDLDCIHH